MSNDKVVESLSFEDYYDLDMDMYGNQEAKSIMEAMEASVDSVEKQQKKKPKEIQVTYRRKTGDEVAIAEEGDVQYIEEYWRLDPRIQKLQVQMVPCTPMNMEWAYWHEPACRAMGMTIFASIVGDGIHIISTNTKIQKALDSFNNDILVMDIIRDLVVDNIIHGESLFIKRSVTIDEVDTFRVFRIDMRTIRKIQHDFEGWKKWRQYAFVRANLPKSKKNFNDEAFDPSPVIDPNYQMFRGEKGMVHITQLTEDEVLFFNLFREAPMMAVLDLVIHKKWIILFMRKTAQRYSTPTPIIKVGNESYHPTSIDNYKKLLKSASDRASKWRNFDAWAIPFNWDVQLQGASGTTLDFPSMVKFLNQEIMLGLSGSISLFENVGNALSTGGHTIESNFLRIVKGLRVKIGMVLKSLYDEFLILRGIVKSSEDLEKEANEYSIQWAELRDEETETFIKGVLEMNREGLMKDKVETRRLLKKVYPDMEDVSSEDELNGDDQYDMEGEDNIPEDGDITELIRGRPVKPQKQIAKSPAKKKSVMGRRSLKLEDEIQETIGELIQNGKD